MMNHFMFCHLAQVQMRWDLLVSYFMGAGMLYYITLAGAAVTLIVFGWKYVVKFYKKRKVSKFKKDLSAPDKEAGPLPSDIRDRFNDGLQLFKNAGRDVNSLPWFLMIGEQNSGKSTAVTAANVGFTMGGANLEAPGRSASLTWWFSNDAVLLDTAGSLVFGESGAGDPRRWHDLLNLMRSNRGGCPFNGLIVVIPADSLLTDSEDMIRHKATAIARQMMVIRTRLDLVFPVFILVTKCDLINGFREFFNDQDVTRQNQLFGWSNPSPIDKPYNPTLTEWYLEEVEERIESRKLQRLQNIMQSGDAAEKRLDQLDALYNFPQSFHRVIAPIKRIIETVAPSNEWAGKSIYLRGIYFTSALRKGAPLDLDVAEALKKPVETLSGHDSRADQASEGSYFLRDVFIERIFQERGLVTDASNVRRRKRRRALFRFLLMLLGVGLLFVWARIAGRDLEEDLSAEQEVWSYSATVIKSADRHGLDLVRPTGTDGRFDYNGNNRIKIGDERMTVAQYQRKLQDIVSRPVRIPFIFRLVRPFGSGLTRWRKQARRVLFERMVLAPTVMAVRTRMAGLADDAWSQDAHEVLEELIRIEADAANLTYEKETDDPADTMRMVSLNRLMKFILSNRYDIETYEVQDRVMLDRIMRWCYTRKEGGGFWPPAWLPDRQRMKGDPPIHRGATLFVNACASVAEKELLSRQLKDVREWQPKLDKFINETEKQYQDQDQDFRDFLEANLDFLTQLEGYREYELEWGKQYKKLNAAHGRMADEFTPFDQAFSHLPLYEEGTVEQVYQEQASNALEEVATTMRTLDLPGPAIALHSKTNEIVFGLDEPTVVDDIKNLMLTTLKQIRDEFQQKGIPAELQSFGKDFRAARKRVADYATRMVVYQPIVMPEDLKINRWARSDILFKLKQVDVIYMQDLLDTFCDQIEKRFIQYGKVLPEAPKEKLNLILVRASEGGRTAKNIFFKRNCEYVLKNWSRLNDKGLDDRDVLLAFEPGEFAKRYLILTSKNKEDYVTQFWENLFMLALETMTDDAVIEMKRRLSEVENIARFPFVLPHPGQSELSLAETMDAAGLIRKIVPAIPSNKGKILAEGAQTASPLVDSQLHRLRTLELDDRLDWLISCRKLLDALPQTVRRRLNCKVWLLAPDEQQYLLDYTTRGDERDDGAVPIWNVIEVYEGLGRRPRKFRTIVDKKKLIGRVSYPGDWFSVKVFRYPSDAQPAYTYVYEGTWAILRLLHEREAIRVQDDPKKWYVNIAMEDDNRHERDLWLQLEFDTELPLLKDWPQEK